MRYIGMTRERGRPNSPCVIFHAAHRRSAFSGKANYSITCAGGLSIVRAIVRFCSAAGWLVARVQRNNEHFPSWSTDEKQFDGGEEEPTQTRFGAIIISKYTKSTTIYSQLWYICTYIYASYNMLYPSLNCA